MRRAAEAQSVDIEGPTGRLEALLELPEAPGPALAIVCHPHPLHGGTMDNKVVHTVARSFHGLGVASLRFNFRGVGLSAGSYADGEGELDDALAVAGWAFEQQLFKRLFLAGFSFGAIVALRASAELDPCGLVTVAPPVARVPPNFDAPSCPWLIVHGEFDELVPLRSVREWCAALQPPPALKVIDGASHFFHGTLRELAESVAEFAGPLATGPLNIESAPRTGAGGAAPC